MGNIDNIWNTCMDMIANEHINIHTSAREQEPNNNEEHPTVNVVGTPALSH
jgi:hypothetical protein